MALLTALITHLDAMRTERQLKYLRALAPEARFVVCHGGRREDFDRLSGVDAVFVDDPSLRGPNDEQSYNAVLGAVYETYVRDDPAVELVYFVEYDQLILAADFEGRLVALAQRSAAGLFAKHAGPREGTNWPHYVRHRNDERLSRLVDRISCRGDRDLWGCLGTGMLFRRDALGALCSLGEGPGVYLELIIPTLVHHLGFDVCNVDAVGDLYAGVRWRPDYTVEEAINAKRAGRAFVHPFKQLDRLDLVSQAPLERVPDAKSSATGLSFE